MSRSKHSSIWVTLYSSVGVDVKIAALSVNGSIFVSWYLGQQALCVLVLYEREREQR